MSFGNSVHLARLYEQAPRTELKAEITKLCEVFDLSTTDVVDELSSEPIQRCNLIDLHLWNRRCEPHSNTDKLGTAAKRFWAAQTLATTILVKNSLDQTKIYSPAIVAMMECGADGLFTVGRAQFDFLGQAANTLCQWLITRRFQEVVLVESPLGNSLPIQVLSELGRKSGIHVRTETWSSPRNERLNRGRTVAAAARDFADRVATADCVLYMDDVATGSRFIKLYDALRRSIGSRRLFGYAMYFKCIAGRNSSDIQKKNHERIARRLAEQEDGPDPSQGEFPSLPDFRVDAGPKVRWETPMIWGDSDLIAGKRKINLIFTLVDHVFGMLADLAQPESQFRQYLANAWERDTGGTAYIFAPDVLEQTFKEITDRAELGCFHNVVDQKARQRFTSDYSGSTIEMPESEVAIRWQWLRDCFLQEASTRITEREGAFLWRAIDHGFAASFHTKRPRPSRDHDYSPYTLPYNDTIRAMNRYLLSRILEMSATELY